ncbi:hypothetical protein D9758_006448 [Tetrapyrgos nigripes]|uniref:Reverse transcriptase domain-containing protein n=1 Tax=Tetrapyrgos nigripes TaxID=182062 RepID=A0A8H5LRD8_9AGAR|nr:hypothetical protein D9758_006448 [Tetrapyrgos nigripes]
MIQDGPTTVQELKILQMNTHKSKTATLDLINETGTNNTDLSDIYDIICIQEPWVDGVGNAQQNHRWMMIYPFSRPTLGTNVLLRSVILINKRIPSSSWQQLEVTRTNDITAVTFNAGTSRLHIFNIYNDGNHSTNLYTLRTYLNNHRNTLLWNESDHMMWCGDFNRHHPAWDDESHTHLFTRPAIDKASVLIRLLTRFDMTMTLPQAIPTYKSPQGNWSRPNNVFLSSHSEDLLLSCDVTLGALANGADHIPVSTSLSLPTQHQPPQSRFNFCLMNDESFAERLDMELEKIPPPRPLATVEEMEAAAINLTRAVQLTIQAVVPKSNPCPRSCHWWTSELSTMKKKLSCLNNQAYKFRALLGHPIHQELREHKARYKTKIYQAKEDHWREFLEGVDEDNIFTAAKYATTLGIDQDRGAPVPTLEKIDDHGNTIKAETNVEKAEFFATAFFTPAPPHDPALDSNPCLNPLPLLPLYTRERIIDVFQGMEPYKAPGPDGIPNVILRTHAVALAPYALEIYLASHRLVTFPQIFNLSDTVVLQKPGRKSYALPKAHRPISLLTGFKKAHTMLITEDISHLAEYHNLLPANQFGGCPCRMTTDAIHLVVDHVKNAWRNKRDATMLSLDIEGAFPSAGIQHLLYNLHRRRIPEHLVQLIGAILKGRKTRLCFGDYTSDLIELENGIDQGDPLSMILFLFYNADFFDLTVALRNKGLSVRFVDNKNIVVDIGTITQNIQTIKTFMEQGGGFKWADTHNCKFALDKLIMVHFPRPRQSPAPKPPPLSLRNVIVKEADTVRVLGVLMDNCLKWKAQEASAFAKATAITLALWRLMRPSQGISMKMIRQLYVTVVIPKMTYGLDVWYSPPHKPEGARK